MKTSFRLTIVVWLCLSASLLHGQQPANSGNAAELPSPTPYVIVQQDANSQVWQQETYDQAPDGSIVTNIHQYTELTTGLNHLINGQWVASQEEIDISPDGNSAAATNGQHQVYFPGDIAQGVIELDTPDGKQLQSRPIGLSYDDGSNTVLIAILTNSPGCLVVPNQVIYPNSFMGVQADLLYTYTKAGFEQDVVLREQPPDPVALGLNSQTTRLQILTEFFNVPQPGITATTVPTAVGNLEDDNLSFGAMQMGQGRAFLLGTNSRPVGVEKQWLLINSRQFLVEEVPFQSITNLLPQLPQTAFIKPSSPLYAVSSKRLLPAQRLTLRSGGHPMRLAQNAPSSHGLVLDYVVATSQNNYTFRGDTTYYVSGAVNLGGATAEGGTIIKYTNSSSAYLYLNQRTILTCATGPYRMAIFTSKDDNSVGEMINGSSGNPSTENTTYISVAYWENSTTYNYLRFAYAGTAISAPPSGSGGIWNCQFVKCGIGYFYSDDGIMMLHNVLFSGCKTNIISNGNGSSGEQLTIDGGVLTTYVGDSATLTNSILTGVTNFGSVTLYDCVTNSSSTGFYQTVGAGNYYLATNSLYRKAGTTNINSTLLAELRQKTTYPPLLLTNKTTSVNTNLTPQAHCDTNSALDFGYHYDPIDYLVDLYSITNATLTLTNGVAIASDNEAGIQLQNGSSIASFGTPTSPNWFVRYSSVQEQPVSLGGTNNSNGNDVYPFYTSLKPSGNYQFTKFACPAGGGTHLYDFAGLSYSNLTVQECEFWSGKNVLGGTNGTGMTLNNNLFARSSIVATGNGSFAFTNNLVWGTASAQLNPASGIVWYAFNNDFDSTVITNSTLTNGYNAYLNCSGRLYPTNAHDIVSASTLAYQSSWLGGFYQPTNSLLIHAGSTNANLVGLYHYTVTTNEVVEGTNTVSIGYHYVATDTNGNPLETLWFGIPDYLADANGTLVAWEMKYFGYLGLDPNADPDGDGNTLLYDYTNGIDPNVITFEIVVTNDYVNTTNAPVQLDILGGVPAYMAVLVSDMNQTDAVWQPYASSNIIVTLGPTNGAYSIYVGLRGLPPDAAQTWQLTSLTLYSAAPTLTITNPTTSVVSQSPIQLQGFASNPLESLSFDVSNAAGVFSNQTGFLTGQFYDTNLLAYTTNYFECSGVVLDSGTNVITLHATDWAGNTANVSFTLDYSPNTNPPVLNLVWPQDGTVISGSNFTLQAQVSDPTAIVTASVNGSAVQGLVEQNGTVWVQNLLLNAGTNAVSLIASNIFGGVSVTNFNVIGNDVGLLIDPLTSDQLNQPLVTVTGSINDPSDTVTVNGVQANVDSETGNWEADNVPVNPTGTASLNVQVGDASNNPLSSGAANQPQPATVVLAGYSGFINTHNSSCSGLPWPCLDVNTINWAYDSGGNETTSGYTPNDAGTAENNFSGSDSLPADGPGFATPELPLAWDYFSVNIPYGEGGDFQRSSQAQLMIAPSGQEPAGTTNVYLVLASASEYSDPVQDFGEGPGDLPLPPEWWQFNGQILVNTGITNADGSVMGAMVVSAVGGTTVTLTPTITQYYTHNAASISDTQVVNLMLQIIDTNTGINLSAQTNTVIVGQQMNLTCQLSVTDQFMTNFPLANFQWTVPGYAISNYVVAPDTNSAVVITNFPLNNSNVVFYWVDGATNRVVQCSATINGKSITGRAVFNIYCPNVLMLDPALNGPPTNLWASSTAVWVTLGRGTIALGIESTLNNMSYDIGVTSSNFDGDAKIVQICTINATGAGLNHCTNWLDNSDPYSSSTSVKVNKNLIPTTPFGLNTMNLDDAPQAASSAFQAISMDDSFVDYVMFNPAYLGRPSIYVPIGKITWSTSAGASWPSTTISPNSVIGPTGPDGSMDFPVWTSVYSNR